MLACLFLSAGPAFYGAVTGDAVRFAPLNAFLGQSASSPAAAFQAYLWKSYSTGTASLGTGISAFRTAPPFDSVMNSVRLSGPP